MKKHHQLSFSELEYAHKRKRVWRDKLFEELDAIYDSQAVRRFVGIDIGSIRAPDRGIGTGGIIPSVSGQMCIGWMDGHPDKVPPEQNMIDFHTGVGGQITYGQWGVGYGQSWTTGKRSSSEITFGGRQLPSGSFGYSLKMN